MRTELAAFTYFTDSINSNSEFQKNLDNIFI